MVPHHRLPLAWPTGLSRGSQEGPTELGCMLRAGIMPIMTYGGFKRMTSFCKTAIPQDISDTLESIKDNDEAVKAFGVDLGVKMCRRLLEAGTPGLHMYTLNLESAAVGILEQLGLVNKKQVRFMHRLLLNARARGAQVYDPA